MDRGLIKQLRHGMVYGLVRQYAIHGGNARIRRDLAFELGRLHRTRDSKGPKGRLAVFKDSMLTGAYVAGYNSPYWWELRSPHPQEYGGSPRLAYYRYLRARNIRAVDAWECVRDRG